MPQTTATPEPAEPVPSWVTQTREFHVRRAERVRQVLARVAAKQVTR